MPKKSTESATYYGHEGVVADANDHLHEVDPSRNLDGSVVEGYESDEREIDDRSGSGHPGEPTFVEFSAPETEPETPETPAPARKRGARK